MPNHSVEHEVGEGDYHQTMVCGYVEGTLTERMLLRMLLHP